MMNSNKLKLLLLLLAGVFVNMVYAQQSSRVKLSTPYPEAGKKISITYNATGGVLQDKLPLTATLYQVDNKDFPVTDIAMRQKGKVWACEATITDSTKAFAIKISGADSVDNNNGQGYIFLVYRHKKPVKGAYIAQAYFYELGSSFGLKAGVSRILDAYNNEIALYPSNKYDADRYNLMMRLHQISPAAVAKKIDSLARTDKEVDLTLAYNLSYLLRKQALTDSLQAIAITKYPNGEVAESKLEEEFFSTKSTDKKDSLYNVLAQEYPSDKEMLGALATRLAITHLEAADFGGFYKYKKIMTDTAILEDLYNSVAYNWAQAGQHIAEAEKFSRESIAMAQKRIDNPKPNFYHTAAEARKSDQQTLDYYLDTYAVILYDEGKYAEGSKVEEPVWERDKPDSAIGGHYALLLIGDKNYGQAAKVLEDVIKAGNGSDALDTELETSYTGKNGSDKGFEPYLASLDSIGAVTEREKMLSIPAPAFALKDLDGNTVSLASLKGKTVILDFWATWCGPCKASMPGMQMAVNKYRDDPSVVFLFVDTWENGDDFVPGVKKFISDNKYNFHVLLDAMDDSGKQGKVVAQYNVEGIPTKFVIDKSGIIRFKYVGYDGTPEGLVTEISKWINMVK